MKVYIQNLWYSFTRDSFLQTPSKSLPGKQENHSPVPLGTSRTASMCIFPSILNCSWGNRKNSITDESAQMGFKNLFYFHYKSNKKKANSWWNFLQPPIQVCRGVCILYFKINAPIFCCLLFFEKYLNPQVTINKMVHTYCWWYEHTERIMVLKKWPKLNLQGRQVLIGSTIFATFTFLVCFVLP